MCEESVPNPHACEESQLVVCISQIWFAWNRMQNATALGCFINVRNTNDCHMKYDNVRISFTRDKYWYEIRDVLIPGLEVIKLEFILRHKIKRNDWLFADTCPQAANHYALFRSLSLYSSFITSRPVLHALAGIGTNCKFQLMTKTFQEHDSYILIELFQIKTFTNT